MQPLQRSYGITEDRINEMISSGTLTSLYDEAKVSTLENLEELTGKDKNKLDNYKKNKPIYDAILEALNNAISNDIYKNPESFTPVVTNLLKDIFTDTKELKKIVDKVVKGLSVMDKTADIQKDKKGNIIYDKDTKDTEIVPWCTDIDDYMASEVLPHVPDAKAFFEEDLGKKNPVIKTGAEIPFTRYFYKYQKQASSDELEKKFICLETSVDARIKKLFGGV
ncbi:N-6 DNA methylase [Sarcina ventriculi]|uniref:N-6 DNA methylase n=1 Tax=Sarcina ventriculi TaxID=1267 RepID=UPI001F45BBFE|nr:N-6 DNA methylase [Sarcina ventriculi]